jgi:hypothetical protein
MFHWKNQAQFKKWNTKNEKLKEKTGYGLELYYMLEDGSIRYKDAIEDISDAINKGLNWIDSEVNIDGKKHPLKED